MTAGMSRNQQDALARKQHFERKRAEQIAKVQRERDIEAMKDSASFLNDLPDYDGSEIIRIDESCLVKNILRGAKFETSREENPFESSSIGVEIHGQYEADITPPFKQFYLWLTEGDLTAIILSVYCIDSAQKDCGTLSIFHAGKNSNLGLNVIVHYKITDAGERCFDYGFFMIPRKVTDEGYKLKAKLSLHMLEDALDAIGLLTLSNIELIDQPISAQLSAACKRQFNRSTIYKVLKVNTGHKQYQGCDRDTGLKDFDPRRMHIVRGHHAEYGTNGRKLLFGKYERKIWIPAHVRGNEEAGIVVKDYEVVSNAN